MRRSLGPPEFEIRLRGHLDERWNESFSRLRLTHDIDPDGAPLTILCGPVLDEAELHGLLARIRDLGIPLLEVRRLQRGDDGADVRLDAPRSGLRTSTRRPATGPEQSD